MIQIDPTGPWSSERAAEFLDDYLAPLRLAVRSDSGYPLVCSLWFRRDGNRLLCATKANSKVAQALRADPRCGFELAPNDPPYFGVRGQGRATLSTDGAVDLLGELIDRYLGDRDSKLASWLLANAEEEVILSIEMERLSSWDYSARMSERKKSG
jgi:hypothetical protein